MSKNRNRAVIALALCCCAALGACSFPGATEIGETSQPAAAEAAVVDAFSLDGAVITLKYESYTYSGSPVTPDDRKGADEVTVTLGGKTLEKGKDYVLSYENNDAPGVAAVIAEGVGDYSGSVRLEFPVKPPAGEITSLETGDGITGLRVNFAPAADCDGYQVLYSTAEDFSDYHTAAAEDPRADHIDLDEVPRPGEKYYVKLRPYVKFDGNLYGNFCDPIAETVMGSIGSVTITDPTVQYTGDEPKLELVVTDTYGTELKTDDYTVTFPEFDGMGTYTVTVTGKGLYSGTAEAQLLLVAGDLADAELIGLCDVYSYTEEGDSSAEDEPPAVGVLFDGEPLVEGEDYEIYYLSDADGGWASVSASGIGNYGGFASQTFKLEKGEWKTEEGLVRYYIGGDAVTGLVSVDGSTYYFDEDGVMQTGWQKIEDDYYCFDRLSGKLVSNTTINKVKVDGAGRAIELTTYLKQRIGVMMHAHEIMLEETDPTDTMEEKRLKLFNWEIYEHSYKQWRLLSNLYYVNDEWDVQFANDIFLQDCGCCVSDSCAVAFLFVEIGYTNVRVCHDTGHSWVTIDDKTFDPVFAEARDFDANYDSIPDDYRAYPPYWIDIDQ
ncbi:MAG: hypothetical protein IJ746_00320 [Ruminococcus sp.]|nr:hypothetical protein [Ruminococcus sp.]